MSPFLEYLYKLRNRGSTYGLDRIKELTCALGNPEEAYPIIHVAGTNGKGSVCAMLASIYQTNGYKVGLFTSPHLIELGERIQINGRNMPMAEIERYIHMIKPIAEKMEKEKEGMYPSFFEIMTAIAFARFKEEGVDLAVVETGLGGRLDSTNVVIPKVSVITSISLDHCDMLGSTVAEIAGEKAGIIKPGVPVVTGWLEPSAMAKISSVAANQKAPLHKLDKRVEDCPTTNLYGSFQRRNAALAVQAVKLLGRLFPVEDIMVHEALLHVELPGRWQVLPSTPTIILDACHNQGGVICLLENLQTLQKPYTVWMAAMGEDRAKEVIEAVTPFAEKIVYFTPDQPRACSFSKMLALTPFRFRSKIQEGNWHDLKSEMDGIGEVGEKNVVITGSIYLVGHVLSFLKKGAGSNSPNLQDIF
jgi:dihydrofolate synthase/folylpolyglutamate synthase